MATPKTYKGKTSGYKKGTKKKVPVVKTPHMREVALAKRRIAAFRRSVGVGVTINLPENWERKQIKTIRQLTSRKHLEYASTMTLTSGVIVSTRRALELQRAANRLNKAYAKRGLKAPYEGFDIRNITSKTEKGFETLENIIRERERKKGETLDFAERSIYTNFVETALGKAANLADNNGRRIEAESLYALRSAVMAYANASTANMQEVARRILYLQDTNKNWAALIDDYDLIVDNAVAVCRMFADIAPEIRDALRNMLADDYAVIDDAGNDGR